MGLKGTFLGVFLGVCSVFGQGFTAAVVGTVTDNSGAVVPQATVTVTNLGTGQQVAIKTDDGGNYTAPQLPPGDYRVAAERQGFRRVVREPINLQVDQRLRLDFVLEVGEITENVTVSAEAEQIQTENATVGTAVTSSQTTELPLNGRNFLQLNLLVPGAQSQVNGSNHSAQGGGLEVHGLRENSNYYWVDGIDNFTQSIGQYVVNVPPFSIEEFRVMSPTYDTEFGRTAGAQLNVITRSGANSYHGDVYLLIRNSAFAAKNFFDPPGPIPVYHRGQFGGDLGGKIIKDRTFFFGAWEGLRSAFGQSASNVVPSPQEIKGNFSDISTPIKDPTTGQQFPGNVIPASRFNPIGAAIASFYPAPNAPNNTLLVSPTSPSNDDVMIAKVDQVVSSRNRLSVRFDLEKIDYFQPIALQSNNTNLPGFGLYNDGVHDYLIGLDDVHTFSPSLIGELRAGFNRFEFQYVPQGHDVNYIGQLGIAGVSQNPNFWGFPVVTMAGLYSNMGPSSSYPQLGPFDNRFASPGFTWVKGKHSLKFGAEYFLFTTKYFTASNLRGTFAFTGKFTGNPLSDLLLGLVNTASVGVPLNNDPSALTFLFVSKQWAGYAQDDWRLTPRLTLTLGMRYEYPEPAYDKLNRMSNFDLATGQLLIAGQNGVGKTLYNADAHEFEPRVGFAWDPKGDGKWAVRGGYGIFYELTMINQVLNMHTNAPFTTTKTVIGDGLAINMSNVFSQQSAAVIPSLSGFSQDYKGGRVQQFSVGVQHELFPGLVLDVGYVGNRGAHLYATINENQPPPGPGTVQTRRPFTQYANINIIEPASSSQYDGLEIRAEKRLSKGSHFLVSYTFSHAYDNNSGSGGTNTPQNAHDLTAEWGPATYDVTQRFVFSYLYELPIGKDKLLLRNLQGAGEAILGGWQLNGILTLHSGQPVTPILAVDNSNTGQNSDRPNLVGDPFQSTASCQTRTPACWMNAAAFVMPPLYTFGTAGRDEIRGPGFEQWDFALVKNWALGEARRVEFRAEAFNLFNHVNLDNPNITLNSSFGRILTAEPSRQMQFGLRFVF